MPPFIKRMGLVVPILLWSSNLWAQPETINIQGSLTDPGGQPLAGTRAFRAQFFDSPADGNPLGAAIDGFVTVSGAGRFSIDLVPPSEVFTATEVYYSLGVDSDNPTDGQVDTEDEFPDRVKVNSVLFARMAEEANSAETATHALSADTAASATSALTLSGQLTNPGDQIPLGGGVVLQVADDGSVEFLTGGERFRLAGQKWFDPRNLLDNISPDGTAAGAAQVAMNNNGEAIIVWQQAVGANQQTFRTEYRDGSWTDPADISPDGQNASDPQVAMNDNGDAVVVWAQSDGSNFQIFRSEYINGSWTDPASLSENISPDGQDARFPQLALNDSGEAVIVWQQSDGANTQIFRSERRNGSWTDPVSLLDNISPDETLANDPQVAQNNAGVAVIVWRQAEGADFQIFRNEYRNGAWTDPSSVSDNISPNGQDVGFIPQVALDNNGDGVIVWYQSNGSNEQIFRSEYRNGAWIDPSSLSDNISPDGDDAAYPQVALSDNGEAVIVWQQSDGTTPQIFKSDFRNGSWVDPTDASDNISPDGQSSQAPQVALNDNGEAIIVWYQSDGTNNQIFRSEYRDGSWRDPKDITDNISPNGTDAESPQVALNNNWDAIIVWRQSDGAFNQIFRSEFRFGF